jgi:hypothetical protein
MAEVKLPNGFIDFKKLDREFNKNLELIYVNELTKRTPRKTGFVADQWSSASLGNFTYVITNPHGDIITFLEEGTTPHTILPRTKKMLRFPIDKAPTFRNAKEKQMFSKKDVIFFFNKTGQAVLGYSKEGSKYFCYAKKVNHPGFEGQHFIQGIIDDKALHDRFTNKMLAMIK